MTPTPQLTPLKLEIRNPITNADNFGELNIKVQALLKGEGFAKDYQVSLPTYASPRNLCNTKDSPSSPALFVANI